MSKKDKKVDLSLREQIKPIFKDRFRELLGEDYDNFEDTILIPQRKSFRINTLKVKNIQLVLERLKEKGLVLSEVPWSENSYFIDSKEDSRTDVGNLFEHFAGEIYVQEATSMCPVEALEIPDEIDDNFKVLDVAASPGSKTTQIGEKMRNRGVLVANELDYSRLGALKSNLERTGIRNVIITNKDGGKIYGEEIFDRILLDAPCSGSGVIRKSPKTIKMYNPKRLKGVRNFTIKINAEKF